MDRYRQKLGEDGYKKTCAENALPVDFEKMSYPDFLEQRRKLMAGIVKKRIRSCVNKGVYVYDFRGIEEKYRKAK